MQRRHQRQRPASARLHVWQGNAPTNRQSETRRRERAPDLCEGPATYVYVDISYAYIFFWEGGNFFGVPPVAASHRDKPFFFIAWKRCRCWSSSPKY